MQKSNDPIVDVKNASLAKVNIIAPVLLGVILASLLQVSMRDASSTDMLVKAYFAKTISQICHSLRINNCERPKNIEASVFIEKLAHSETLNEAMKLARWNGGTEREAVRYLALVRALQSEKWPNKGLEKPWTIVRDALAPSWALYPKITVASQCYWCSYHDSNIYEWFTNLRYHDDYLLTLMEYTPHLFGQFEQYIDSSERKHAMAIKQSMLANHGNRYGFLGRVLFENQDWDALRVLVANTNSAAPIMELNWNELPEDIVRLSWQQGVRAADDLPVFTAKMIRAGYRPALRWALWVVSEGRSNPALRRLSGHLNAYQTLIEESTDFPLSVGETWDSFYTQHWRQIVFDASAKKWVVQAN